MNDIQVGRSPVVPEDDRTVREELEAELQEVARAKRLDARRRRQGHCADSLRTHPSFSAHSLRAGFVTEAKSRGLDDSDIMRHKSLQMMLHYNQGTWWNNNAAGNIFL